MSRTGTPYDRYGTHAQDLARETAPGVGLYFAMRRLCVKCQKDKPIKGSTTRCGLFICGDCRTPKVQPA